VTKFGIVFLALLGVSALWGVGRGGIVDRAREHAAVARNEGITALAGAILYVLLAAVVGTVLDIAGLLSEHYLVGFLLIPPVMLKLASTGYRFIRYYTGSEPYRLAGAPPLLLRFVVGPVLAGSTIAVLLTGVELWLFGLRFGTDWMAAHTFSAVVMLVAVAPHVVAHFRRSADVVRADIVTRTDEALSGRSLVLASLLLGAAVAAASLLYPSPFPASAAGG
jgi:hypothetical protein